MYMYVGTLYSSTCGVACNVFGNLSKVQVHKYDFCFHYKTYMNRQPETSSFEKNDKAIVYSFPKNVVQGRQLNHF